jgi:glycosyltransferase involved in cell wall biosynthesis
VKILYIAHRIPYPPNKGDKIRSFNELKYLSTNHEIHLACLADDPKDLEYSEDLKKYCKTVNVIPINPRLAKFRSIFYLLSRKPLSVPYFYSSRLQDSVDQLLSTDHYDVIFCFSSSMAEYVFKSEVISPQSIVLSLKAKGHQSSTNNPTTINQKLSTNDHRLRTKLIMDFVDVDSDKWAQYAKVAHFPMSWIYRLEASRLAAYERGVAKSFGHSIFVTKAEEKMFKDKNPHIQNISVISNGVDLDYFSPHFPQRQVSCVLRPASSNQQQAASDQNPATSNQQQATRNEHPVLVFTGAMDYFANVDGVVWFTKEVLPLIKRELAATRFYIVGSNPTKEVLSLWSNDGVIVTGYVPDTREYLGRASVVVVPLRIAQGIQNKILEAMAMGIPVVATPQAFEGIEAEPGVDLILGESPEKFAMAVIKLVKEVSLRKSLGENARKVIEKNYCWSKNLSKLDALLDA